MGKDMTPTYVSVKQYNDLVVTKIQIEIKYKRLEQLFQEMKKK